MCNNPNKSQRAMHLFTNGFNDYLGPLVNLEGATSISTILLVDIDVGSFSPYKYVPTPWAKHTKTTIRRAPSLRNLSCSKLDFSPPSLAAAVTIAAAPLRSCCCHGRVVAVREAKG